MAYIDIDLVHIDIEVLYIDMKGVYIDIEHPHIDINLAHIDMVHGRLVALLRCYGSDVGPRLAMKAWHNATPRWTRRCAQESE